MQLFDVYPLFDVAPVRAEGCYLWDASDQQYLDLYGGHAVISIGHAHPHYIKLIRKQIERIGFYSNSVKNPLQAELAEKLGELAAYPDYRLFLCNSGAEAIENALKLASFQTKRKKVLFLERSFHGRTSAAVGITDNPKIQAPVNYIENAARIGFNDISQLEAHLATETYCAVVIEGIQGVGGIHMPSDAFLQAARELCNLTQTVLILDEIQSGYGRTGKFFAHQHAGIKADLITIAKGMANGFPIGGVLIGPQFDSWHGMLGTTFGGNHLACAAAIAVLDVLKSEKYIEETAVAGTYAIEKLRSIPGIKEVRGLGWMIGIELNQPAKAVRLRLLKEHQIFTGSSSQANVLRLLPPLCVTKEQFDNFFDALTLVLSS
ncbi:MAG: aminotransferase class III-fold pyridoxal phosphate-dependent enzyme [Bacteroidota bacterium]